MQFLVGKQKAISLILTPWCSAKNEGVNFFTAFLKVDLIERQKSILKKKSIVTKFASKQRVFLREECTSIRAWQQEFD